MSGFTRDWALGLKPDPPEEEDFPGDMPLLGKFVDRLMPELELSAQIAKLTESPIETMLARAILQQWWNIELRAPGDPWAPEWTLIPQYPWGRYRIDIALRKPNGSFVFIECDGHEFHSTPEQIARDRTRQREIEAAGIPVMRFTGYEIHYSAVACVDKIGQAFRRWGQ